jgi:predicted enzyme related to lactoylglutathione lyase
MTLRGLRTVIYPAPDLAASTAWWTEVLGFGPYFQEPFYVGFEVDGDELGLLPDAEVADGALVYFAVDDVPAELATLVAKGATVAADVADVGGGIVTALARSPQGSLVGLIFNPNDAG